MNQSEATGAQVRTFLLVCVMGKTCTAMSSPLHSKNDDGVVCTGLMGVGEVQCIIESHKAWHTLDIQ